MIVYVYFHYAISNQSFENKPKACTISYEKYCTIITKISNEKSENTALLSLLIP